MLFRLVGLMGREAFTNWSEQVRAGSGRPPTSGEVEDMLAICGAYGEGEFKRMMLDDYGGGEKREEGAGIVPAAPAGTVAVSVQPETVKVPPESTPERVQPEPLPVMVPPEPLRVQPEPIPVRVRVF